MLEAESGNSGASSSLTDAIGIGTLTRLVPRELVDEVVFSLGCKLDFRIFAVCRVPSAFALFDRCVSDDGVETMTKETVVGFQAV